MIDSVPHPSHAWVGHRVFKQTGANSLALPGRRHGEARQQHDRHRMTGQALGEAFGCAAVLDRAHHHCVVADDLFLREGDIGLGGFCLLVRKHITNQESIEGFTAAVKRIDGVTASQLLDTSRGHLNAASLEDARLPEKPGKAGGGARRRGQCGLECLPLLCIQPEALAVRQGFFGAGVSPAVAGASRSRTKEPGPGARAACAAPLGLSPRDASFAAQGNDRVDAGGPVGRDPGRERGRDHQHQGGDEKRTRVVG